MQDLRDGAGSLTVQVVPVQQLPAARTDASEKLRQQQLPRHFIEERVVGRSDAWHFTAEESVRGVGAPQIISGCVADRPDQIGFNGTNRRRMHEVRGENIVDERLGLGDRDLKLSNRNLAEPDRV
jgi:hypothetical protein